MNRHPTLGTAWKGRVLMKIDVIDDDNPKLEKVSLEEKEIKEAAEFLKPKPFQFIAEVGSLIVPPKLNKKYSIEIAIGEKRFNTSTPTA